jgi:hypothetical protein
MCHAEKAVLMSVQNSSLSFAPSAWPMSSRARQYARRDVGGRKIRVLANAAALLLTLSVMGGLISAQRDYQNSWHEPIVTQSSVTSAAKAGTAQGAGPFKVVLK